MNPTKTDLLSLTARSLMTSDLLCAERDESLTVAAARMASHGVHCLLVPAEDVGRAPGIITGKDIVQVLAAGDASMLEELHVEDVMSSPAVTVSANLVVLDCINLMRMAGVRAVFVTEGLEPIGLLSFTDVLRAVGSTD